MAQRKETKKTIKVRDMKPKKDAKGGFTYEGPRQQGAGKQITRPGRGAAKPNLVQINPINKAD